MLRRDFSWVSHGGGLCHSAAVAQLRSVLPLHEAACTTAVREQLLVATADLAMAAAYASYDAEHHDDARRLFTLALNIAQQAEDPRAADLTAFLLMDMADQALHLRQPREDLDTAARIGHHAVQEITALASPRAYDRLRTLDTVLQPHTTNPTVSEVRGQIQAALAMA